MREPETPRPLTVRTRVLARILNVVSRVLYRTWRVEVVGEEAHLAALAAGHGAIQATWHGRALAPGHRFAGRGHIALISLSRDGDIQNRNFHLMGYRTVRGSTGRGAVRATLEVVQLLRAGGVLSFTPDGPRGPSRNVHPGAVYFARKTGAPVLPVGCGADRAWILPTWDDYLVPKPFARVAIVLGEAVMVDPTESDDVAVERVRSALDRAQSAAEARFAPRAR
ncbi:MAG: lysophospholipid acyltransferase family protein [Armatimonadota bacterium]